MLEAPVDAFSEALGCSYHAVFWSGIKSDSSFRAVGQSMSGGWFFTFEIIRSTGNLKAAAENADGFHQVAVRILPNKQLPAPDGW